MKIWIDMSTPKEVLFFKPFIEEFKARGHSVVITTRKYTETNDLLNYFGIPHTIHGRHGTARAEKLWCALARMVSLFKSIVVEKPDCLVTLINSECCRIAYGLGIPIHNFIDIPEAQISCRLTLPLSTTVFIPFHVKLSDIRHYYTGPVYKYECLDPIAYMPKNPEPEESIFGKPLQHPFILYRQAEAKASYFSGLQDYTERLVTELKKIRPHACYYPLPRYEEHPMLDLQSLLYYTDVFIGGGGTITEEACYWGTPSISCRPFLASYDQWLIDHGFLEHPDTFASALKLAISMVDGKYTPKRNNELYKQVFPLEEICDIILDSNAGINPTLAPILEGANEKEHIIHRRTH